MTGKLSGDFGIKSASISRMTAMDNSDVAPSEHSVRRKNYFKNKNYCKSFCNYFSVLLFTYRNGQLVIAATFTFA
jgi:hypothetical protein